jgi:hypothetical protein
VVALVARPHVADASGGAKLGSLGNQQDVTATRAVGSTKIMGRGVLGVGAMAAHRRFSSTLPHAPRSGLIRLDVACHLWRPCDAFVKLSWPGMAGKFNLMQLGSAAGDQVRVMIVLSLNVGDLADKLREMMSNALWGTRPGHVSNACPMLPTIGAVPRNCVLR